MFDTEKEESVSYYCPVLAENTEGGITMLEDNMFTIHNIFVEQGDCFLIELQKDRKYFSIMVDGGYARYNAYKKVKQILNGKRLNMLIVTHIDKDHICGAAELLDKGDMDLSKTCILFNKYDENRIGYKDGENLYEKITHAANEDLLVKSYDACFRDVNEKIQTIMKDDESLELKLFSIGDRKLEEKIDSSIVNITILWPDDTAIDSLMRNWSEKKVNARMFNRSSIVFLLEFSGRSALMMGDAYVSDVMCNVEELLRRKRISKVDLIKMPHHGAKDNNEGIWDMTAKLNCCKLMLSIKQNQENEEVHPNRELLNSKPDNVSIFAGTKINCEGLKNICYKGKVEL